MQVAHALLDYSLPNTREILRKLAGNGGAQTVSLAVYTRSEPKPSGEAWVFDSNKKLSPQGNDRLTTVRSIQTAPHNPQLDGWLKQNIWVNGPPWLVLIEPSGRGRVPGSGLAYIVQGCEGAAVHLARLIAAVHGEPGFITDPGTTYSSWTKLVDLNGPS